MKAIMLAGGKGSRAQPFTILTPKLYQQVCGIPVLEYMLSWFAGCPEIDTLYVIVRSQQARRTLERYVRERHTRREAVCALFSRLGLSIEERNAGLSIEAMAGRGWGTAGDLMLLLNDLPPGKLAGEDLLVCYGDHIVARRLDNGSPSLQLDLCALIGQHRAFKKSRGTLLTMALVPVEKAEAHRFGLAHLSDNGNGELVTGFIEKPRPSEVPEAPLANAGLYVLDRDLVPELASIMPQFMGTDIARDLLPLLVAGRSKVAASRLELSAWFDVGTPEKLVEASCYIAALGAEARPCTR